MKVAGMIGVGAALMFACATNLAFAEIKKCKGSDGKVYYTDKLCPSETKLEGTMVTADDRRAARQKESMANTEAKGVEEKPEVINFSGGISQQFSKAQSIVKVAVIDGRDCEWGIKVHRDISKCANFAKILKDDSEFKQAVKKIITLLDEDKNKEVPMHEYSSILDDAKEVERYKDLMVSYINSR